MITGIGIDIEEIKRFKGISKNNTFLKRVYTDREILQVKQKPSLEQSFAVRFCAKEAVMKAHGRKMPFTSIELLNSSSGKPEIFINGKIKKNILVSVSHTKNIAVAYVVIAKK